MNKGYIYMISNDINDKKYIGQTKTSIAERWQKHLDNAKNCPNKQVITQAIHKYGKEHFQVEELAKVNCEDLDDMEIYYIRKYDSFQNGYNMTVGGNNSSAPISEDIVSKVIELALNDRTNYTIISDTTRVNSKTVKKILNRHDIKIKNPISRSKGNIDNLRSHWGKHTDNLVKPCPIRIVELDKSFNSMLECAKFLIKNNYTKTNNEIYVMKSISRALADKNYQRKTYLGFHLEKL